MSQYRPGQGWRLSSSWGKPNGIWPDSNGLPNDKDKDDAEKKWDWRTEFQNREDEFAARFEALRRKIEKDPYSILFGKASERGVWNPFALFETQVAARPSSQPSNTQRSQSNAQRQEHPKTGLSEEASLNKGAAKAYSTLNHDSAFPHQSPSLASTNNTAESLHPRANESLEDYVIDPISMRKVPRRQIDPIAKSATSSPHESVNIPVKTYAQSKSTDGETTYSSRNAESSPRFHSGKSETRSSTTESKRPQPPYRSSHPWLTREGFGVRADSLSGTTSATATKDLKAEPTATASQRRVESSLDRHLRAAHEFKQKTANVRPPLEYRVEDNKAEDLDMLRASDVRARSGQAKSLNKDLQEAKLEHRKKFDDAFDKRMQKAYLEDAEEMAVRKAKQSARQSQVQADKTITKPAPELEESYLNKLSAPDSPVTNVDSWGYDLVPQKRSGASRQDTLENEIQNNESSYAYSQQVIMDHPYPEENITTCKPLRQEQEEHRPKEEKSQDYQHQHMKPERENKRRLPMRRTQALAPEFYTHETTMNHVESSKHDSAQATPLKASIQLGEGDMSENVHEFASRDRWYKNKAPHATEQDSSLDKFPSEQEVNVHPLVREIKGIYEDTYGSINVNHRQAVLYSGMEGKEDPAVQRGLQEYDNLHATAQNPKLKLLSDHTFASKEPNQDGKPNWADSFRKQIEPSTTSGPIQPAPPLPAPSSSASKPSRNTYKILALNHGTHEVTSVTTTSSLHEASSLPRSASAILSHLSHPASFISHLEALEGTDFELIAGNRNMLLYKKMDKGREEHPNAETTKKHLSPANSSNQNTTVDNSIKGEAINSNSSNEEVKRTNRHPVNPIDGTTGRFASPTGFVNHDAVFPSSESSDPPTTTQPTRPFPGETVRREEDVFSGSPRTQWSDEEPKGRADRKSGKKSSRGGERASFGSRVLSTVKGVVVSMLVYGSVFGYIYAVGWWMSQRRERRGVREEKEERTGRKREREYALTGYGPRAWTERE